MKTLSIAIGLLGFCALFAIERALHLEAVGAVWGVVIFAGALIVHAFHGASE